MARTAAPIPIPAFAPVPNPEFSSPPSFCDCVSDVVFVFVFPLTPPVALLVAEVPVEVLVSLGRATASPTVVDDFLPSAIMRISYEFAP